MLPENLPRPLRIASFARLRQSWLVSRDATRRQGSAGADLVTPGKFREDLDRNIQRVHRALVSGTYRFAPLRAVPIPKEGGRHRIICVPSVADRLVQRLLVDYLTEKDKLGVYNSVSYGFVRGRGGVHQAVKKAKNIRAEYPWAFKSDITAFFDNINRDLLKDRLFRKLGKSSILPLLSAAIDCEVDVSDKATASDVVQSGIVPGRGLRQGMPLSPLLSNFVLREFDLFFERSRAHLIRYADDFVLFAKTERECAAFFPLVRELPAKQNHAIPEPGAGLKTVFRAPDEAIEFLGFEVAPRHARSGYEILVPQLAFAEIKKKVDRFSRFDQIFNEYKRLSRAINKLESIVVGFVNVYRPAKNYKDLESHARNCQSHAVRSLLTSIFGADVLHRLDRPKMQFLELSDLIPDL